jgi:D-sedoheptulose 7-phosphate isomerase
VTNDTDRATDGSTATTDGADDGLAAYFGDRIAASIAAKQALADQLGPSIAVGRAILASYQAGGKLIVFGNGGSAADAQHIAAEFVGRFYIDRRALPAMALNVNTSAVTAIGNDFGFDALFARQVEAFGRPGDIALGLSTSGNSSNVVAGLRAAREGGLVTVALVGERGGKMAEYADHVVTVPSADTPRVQESHILLGHIWSEMVEQALFGTPTW